MISAPLKALLDAIGKHEAPKGYGQIYSGAKGVSKATDVSRLTLNGVLGFQKRMLAGGSASTACGRYQFLRKTLMATIIEMGLGGDDVWTPELQDRMALHLIEKRGLSKFQAGRLSRETFANNLAMEWASLPVPQDTFNGKRTVKAGQSYYAGDGLNKSFHSVASVLALLDAIKPTEMPAGGVLPLPAPDTPPNKPRGLLAALTDLIMSIFKRKT